jgi:magnesium transporter
VKVEYQHQNGVRALLCTENGMVQPDIDPDSIDTFIADGNNLLWLDIDTSVSTDLSLLDREFGFHELALEDAVRERQRPKVEEYAGFTFLIFYAVNHDAPLKDIQARQVAIFIGANYMVTVHNGPLTAIDESATRLRRNIEKINRNVAVLLYTLLDAIVDDYFPMIDRAEDLVDDIEQAVFEHFSADSLKEIFKLKKSLIDMRRWVAPEREVLNTLIRRESPLFGDASLIYFQDVYDHIVRALDSVDLLRDQASNVLDAYLSMSSNRLNEVMKTLTSLSIPLMAGALVAGIWGMNFEYVPLENRPLGFWILSAVVVVSFLVILAYFRRRKWL